MAMWQRVKAWLQGLSFRTGVMVLASCAVFYGISFAWLLAPLSYAAKGALWAVFFGLAKAAQYSGLIILGKVGVQRLKEWLKRDRQADLD